MKKGASKFSVKLLSLFMAIVMLLPTAAILSAGEVAGGLNTETQITQGGATGSSETLSQNASSNVTTLAGGTQSDKGDNSAAVQSLAVSNRLDKPLDVQLPQVKQKTYYRYVASPVDGQQYYIVNSNTVGDAVMMIEGYYGIDVVINRDAEGNICVRADDSLSSVITAAAKAGEGNYVAKENKFTTGTTVAGQEVYAYEAVTYTTAQVTDLLGVNGAVPVNELDGENIKIVTTKNTKTGTHILFHYPDGSRELVPVTVDMLKVNVDGVYKSLYEELAKSHLTAHYANLKLEYGGVTITDNYALSVVLDVQNYRPYPEEGSIRADKQTVTSDYKFSETGIVRVDVSAAGIAKKVPMDVLVLVDAANGEYLDTTRDAVMELIDTLATPNQDGTSPDIDVAIAQFDKYTYFSSNNALIGATPATAGESKTKNGFVCDYTNVQEAKSFTPELIVSQNGVSNYDIAMQFAYETISQRINDSAREQVVVFISNGDCHQYNYISSNATADESEAWYRWLTGGIQEFDTTYLTDETKIFCHNEGKHFLAEAIKSTSYVPNAIVKPTLIADSEYKEEYLQSIVEGLGSTIFTVDIGSDDTLNAEAKEQILTKMASSADNYYKVDGSVDGAFNGIIRFMRKAATNAGIRDQIGEMFVLQTATAGGKAPTISINTYDLYKHNEVGTTINGVYVTEGMVGSRKSDVPTSTLETVTFSADGTKAYSSEISKNKNILTGNQINARYFTYNFETKKFNWNIGIISEDETVLSYYVYLENSITDGESISAGIYDVGGKAELVYNNYMRNPRTQEISSTTVAWQKKVVKYGFYLVDNNGSIIVNKQTTGTGAFADKIAVTKEIPVEMSGGSVNITTEMLQKTIKDLNASQNGYALFDENVSCTVTSNGENNGGSWAITSAGTTTYVTGYNGTSNALSNTASSGDFNNITVWFAVKDNIGVKDDVVVIDYGLPVIIDVLGNDYFPGTHVLRGVLLGSHPKMRNISANGQFINYYGGLTQTATNANKGYINTSAHDILFKEEIVSGKKFTAYSYMHCDIDYTAPHYTQAAGSDRNGVKYTPWVMDIPEEEHYSYCVEYNPAGVDLSKPVPSATAVENSKFYIGEITIVPATSIYFEEEFIDFYDGANAKWKDVDSSVLDAQMKDNYHDRYNDYNQDEDRPGSFSLPEFDFDNIYGSDSRYANSDCYTYSLGNAKYVDVNVNDNVGGPKAKFTFTGTGFDLFSVTSGNTGTLSVEIMTAGNAETVKYMTEEDLITGNKKPWIAYPTYEYEMYIDDTGYTVGGDGCVIPSIARSTKNYDKDKYASVTVKNGYQIKYYLFSEDLEYVGCSPNWIKASGSDRSVAVESMFDRANYVDNSVYKDQLTPKYFRIQFSKIGGEDYGSEYYGKNERTGHHGAGHDALRANKEWSFIANPTMLTDNLIIYLKEPGKRGQSSSSSQAVATAAYEMPVVAAAAAEAEEMTVDFEQGYIKSADGQTAYVVRTPQFLEIDDYSSITIPAGYAVKYYLYTSSAEAGNSGWLYNSSGTYTLTNATMRATSSTAVYFKLVIGRQNQTQFTPAVLAQTPVIFTPFNRSTVEPTNQTVSVTWAPGRLDGTSGLAVVEDNVSTINTYAHTQLLSIDEIHRFILPSASSNYQFRYHFYADDVHLGCTTFAKNTGGAGVYITEGLKSSYATATHFRVLINNTSGSVADSVKNDFKFYRTTAASSATGTTVVPSLANHTITNGTDANSGGNRIRTSGMLVLDNYKDINLIPGYKLVYHLYDASGDWLAYYGADSSKRWVLGSEPTITIAQMKKSNPDAVYFRLVLGKADDSALTISTFPANALTLTEVYKEPEVPDDPELPDDSYTTVDITDIKMNQVNILGDTTNKGKEQANNNRISTDEMYSLSEYESVKLDSSYSALYHLYDANGNWIGYGPANGSYTTGKGDTALFTTEYMSDTKNCKLLLSGAGEPAYFKITVRNAASDSAIKADTFSGLTLVKKVYKPEGDAVPTDKYTQGTIDAGKELTTNNNRIFTTEYYDISLYDGMELNPGNLDDLNHPGYKAAFHVYKKNDDGSYTWLGCNANWKYGKNGEILYYTASMDSFHPDATHFRLVIARVDDEEFTVADFNEDTNNEGLILFAKDTLVIPGDDVAASPGNDPDAGILVKRYIVNTYYGYTRVGDRFVVDSTIPGTDKNALYQIPVISWRELPYNTYTVTITPMYSPSFDPGYVPGGDNSVNNYRIYIDSVRIYNPSGLGNTEAVKKAYMADGEYAPQYINMRQVILGNHEQYGQLVEGTGIGSGAVFIDGKGDATVSGMDDVMLKISPNNEIYLAKNQAIAFHLQAKVKPATVHLGMKTVSRAKRIYPLLAQGTLDAGGLHTNNITHRLYTTGDAMLLSEIENIQLAKGYKAAYQLYDASGKWVARNKGNFVAPNQNGVVFTAEQMNNPDNWDRNNVEGGTPVSFKLVIARDDTTADLAPADFPKDALAYLLNSDKSSDAYATATIISYDAEKNVRTQRTQEVKGAHEMYYDVASAVEWVKVGDVWQTTQPIVIYNNSDSILSMTQLKAAFNSEAYGEVKVVVDHNTAQETYDEVQEIINEN